MINKKDILKMVRNVHRQSKGSSAKRIINPERDWFLLLGFGFLVLSIGIGYSAWQFKKFNNIEDNLEESSSSVVRYDKASVERAIEVYEDKDRAFSVFENAITAPVAEVIETPVVEVEGVEGEEVLVEEGLPVDLGAPVQFE